MSDDRKTNQASRYVLGALPAEEQREFEAALQKDEKLQELVKELRGTAGSTLTPKSSLAIPAEVRLTPPASIPTVTASPRGAAWILWPPWVLMAAFGVVCLMLLSSGDDLRQRMAELSSSLAQKDHELAALKRQTAALEAAEEGLTNVQRRARELEEQFVRGVEKLGQQAALTNQLIRQLAEARSETASAQSNVLRLAQAAQTLEAAVAALAARETNRLATVRLVALRAGPVGAGSAGALYWSGVDQRGVLTADPLPALLPIQSLQLWLVAGTNPPVSGGLLPRNAGGVAIHFTPAGPIDNLRRAFVTVESAFGAASPGDQIVLDSN